MHSRFLSVKLAGNHGTASPRQPGSSHRRPSTSAPAPSVWLSDTALLIYIALATVVLHLIIGNRYGIHRDELATLEDARHLAWGYPAYPPVTPFFGRISLELFGTSIRGFRFFANVAQAIAVVLTGLMARDMGARRGAQLVAAVAAVPFCLGGGYEMMYVAFDALAWVLTAYFVVRLLASEDPRWWLGIGAGIGFGMHVQVHDRLLCAVDRGGRAAHPGAPLPEEQVAVDRRRALHPDLAAQPAVAGAASISCRSISSATFTPATFARGAPTTSFPNS